MRFKMLFKDQYLFHIANVCFHMINSNRVGSHVLFRLDTLYGKKCPTSFPQ